MKIIFVPAVSFLAEFIMKVMLFFYWFACGKENRTIQSKGLKFMKFVLCHAFLD